MLVNDFQFLILVFETFCWSDDTKVLCSFKLFIDIIISFWISLSRVHLAIFAFADFSDNKLFYFKKKVVNGPWNWYTKPSTDVSIRFVV